MIHRILSYISLHFIQLLKELFDGDFAIDLLCLEDQEVFEVVTGNVCPLIVEPAIDLLSGLSLVNP